MKKHVLSTTLLIALCFQLSSCSLFSSGSEETEAATDEVSVNAEDAASDSFEEGDGDFDPEAMASEGETTAAVSDESLGEDVIAEDDFGSDSGTDNYPDDDYAGDSSTTAKAVPDVSSEIAAESDIDDNSFGSDDYVAVDEGGGIPEAPMEENQEQDLFASDSDAEGSGPVVDTPTFSKDTFTSSFDDSAPVVDAPQLVSVKKMKSAAYAVGSSNINRIYIARSGDDMAGVSQKIYGQDRTKDLYKYNPHFKGKSLKVGDKVYYESALNPNDQTMLTYYEENGIQPQYYTSAENDNIRTVSKQLLGHERSWMEVYATNPSVESKGSLPAGLQLRYWPDGSVPVLAKTPSMPTPPPPPVMDNTMPEEVPPPAEMDSMASNDIPMDEPPPVDMSQAQEVAQIDDPQAFDNNGSEDPGMADPNSGGDFTPPPSAGTVGQVEPPAPPSPPPAPKAAGADFNSDDPLAAIGDDSMIIGAIGGLLILAFVIMLIFIRRNRAKRVNFSQTQI